MFQDKCFTSRRRPLTKMWRCLTLFTQIEEEVIPEEGQLERADDTDQDDIISEDEGEDLMEVRPRLARL